MSDVTATPGTVTVVPAPIEADDIEVDVEPASPPTTLALLRAKRAQLERQMHKDFAVPRWDDVLDGRRLWVRYRPADPMKFATASQKREKAHRDSIAKGGRGDPRRVVKANADILVDSCVAVFDLPVGEEPPAELERDLPTFSSPELSQALGAPENAVETVLKLYATDGDVLVMGTQLMEWSGLASKEAGDGFFED